MCVGFCWFFWQCCAGYLLIIFCDSYFCIFADVFVSFPLTVPFLSHLSTKCCWLVMLLHDLADLFAMSTWLHRPLPHASPWPCSRPSLTSTLTYSSTYPYDTLIHKHSYLHTHNHIHIQKKGSDDHLFIVTAYGIMHEQQSSD